MASERNFWYHVGYALERARASNAPVDPPTAQTVSGKAPARRSSASPARSEEGEGLASFLTDKALAATAVASGGALLSIVLSAWRPRYRPGPAGLARAGLAGAGAAVVRMLAGRLLDLGPLPPRSADPLAPLLAGAARGMVYASVVEPRLPGPPVLRGASYGALEYAASPWGGLEDLLDVVPPHRRVPFLSGWLDTGHHEPTLAGHLVFGVIVASLYGGPGRSE